MSIIDSGMDVIIELKNAYVRRIFENLFRSTRVCPPINLTNQPNPDRNELITAVDLVPRLKSTQLRQQVNNNIPTVFLDLTLEPSVGTLFINGAPSNEVTISIRIVISVTGGQITLQPDPTLVLLLTAANPALGNLFASASVAVPLDLLNINDFSLTPIAAALKLVGPQNNLAIGLDVNLTGTIKKFSGDCKKSETTLPNTNLNGLASDISKFQTSYNTALITSSGYSDMVIILDQQVIAAKIRTLNIDKLGVIENTALLLLLAEAGKLKIGGQGCAYFETVAGNWWDTIWKASAEFVVQNHKLVVNYIIENAALATIWDTCVNIMEELKNRGLDKGTQDLGVSAGFGDSSNATGYISIYNVEHRSGDIVLYAKSDLLALANPQIKVPSNLLFATPCDAGKPCFAEFYIESSSEDPLHVCEFRIDNNPAGIFQVEEPTTPFTFIKKNWSDKRKVRVKCTGQAGKNYLADLRIMSNGGPATVHLEGLLASAKISVPDSFEINGKLHSGLCRGSSLESCNDLQIDSTGLGTLLICSLTIEDDVAKAFDIPYEIPPIPVRPGDSHRITICYHPDIFKDYDKTLTAKLKIETNAGTVMVNLSGKIEFIHDFNFKHFYGEFCQDLIVFRIEYFKTKVRIPIPRDIFSDFINVIKPSGGDRKTVLFLETLFSDTPRNLKIELFGTQNRPIANFQSRFPTKFMFFPCQKNEQYSLLLTSRAIDKNQIGRFILRAWSYEVVGSISSTSTVRDFVVSGHHMFYCNEQALMVGRVEQSGSVKLLAEINDIGDVKAMTTVGNLLLVVAQGCQIFNITIPLEPVHISDLDIPGAIQGLYNPEQHLRHINSELARSGAFRELIYVYGEQLHTFRVKQDGTSESLSSNDLMEPAFRALAWGHILCLFGPSTLQLFDIANPFSPKKLGVYRSKKEITTGLILGCMAVLVHEGPSITLVDITRPDRLSKTGTYVPQPALAELFPTYGPIFIDERFVYTLDGTRQQVLLGRLNRVSLDQEKIRERREAQGTMK